jgi:branched-chain amino acid transport system ATP-binding protein/urea transport system ATP-binding protein
MNKSNKKECVLETRGLGVRFGGVVAVDSVNFKLRKNELRCLIGPNGAGKTSFFRCLTGQYTPTQGDVWLAGQKITGWPSHEVARLGVGIKTQIPNLMNGLTVRENVWLAARRENSNKRAIELDEKMLERQRVELGMVLVAEPWLLLLDEPAGGLTHDEVEQMAELIHEVGKTTSVIVVEHDMAFVRQIAQQVTVFHQGRVLREGDVDEVLSDPVVREVYLGKKAK